MRISGTVLLLLASVFVSTSVSAQQQELVTSKEILAAWKERSETIESVRYKMQTIYMKGETVRRNTTELLISGVRVRNSSFGDDKYSDPRALTIVNSSAFDGSTLWSHSHKCNANNGKSYGWIKSSTESDAARQIDAIPVFWHFTPTIKSSVKLDFESMEILSDNLDFDNRRVRVKAPRLPAGTGYYELEIDPDRAFSIVLADYYVPFGDTHVHASKTNITLKQTDSGEWIPKSWEYKRIEKDRKVKSELLEFELNPEVTDDDFKIVFPEDTPVDDSRKK